MKIIITGHTSGIGLSLSKVFSSNGHEVFGYSRSTGYNIEDYSVRKKIIEESKDSDIFINNAYSPKGQTLLLSELIENWNNQEKKIINISSKLSHFPLGKIPFLDQYIIEKSKQNSIVQDRLSIPYPQILNVIVGLVDTPMSEVFKSKKINPDSLSKMIYEVATNNEINVQQLMVDVVGLDWKNITGL
jgi:short-subunit dehydrogenase involved in D-alanine esterification of teichoic acids